MKIKTVDHPVRMVESLIVEGKRNRDTPKKWWEDRTNENQIARVATLRGPEQC